MSREYITNELVNWFNAVDETYRSDLRELNELNFARFDAKFEQRVAALDAKIEQRVAALDAKLEKRAVALDAKIEQLGTALRAEMKAGLAELRVEMSKGFEKLGSGLLKWLFSFWASVVLALVLLAFRVS